MTRALVPRDSAADLFMRVSEGGDLNFRVLLCDCRHPAKMGGSQWLPRTTAPSDSGDYLSATPHAISKALASRHLRAHRVLHRQQDLAVDAFLRYHR